MRNGLRVHGTNNLTPGAASPGVSTLLTSADAVTGLQVTFGSGTPSDQDALRVVRSNGNTVMRVRKTYVEWIDQRAGASQNVGTGAPSSLHGGANTPCLALGDGTTGSVMRIWGGTGAPSSTTVAATAAVGDLYFRRDSFSAGSRLYRCTVAGAPGTWAGIA